VKIVTVAIRTNAIEVLFAEQHMLASTLQANSVFDKMEFEKTTTKAYT
jgi:hypothetical protein